MSENNPDLLELTASVIAAFVAHNRVPVGELTTLIVSTHAALDKLGQEAEPPAAAPLVPAVPVRKSVTHEAIISLEDGKPFKSLKRQLSRLGMTPDQYRSKWGLPHDYPMVAPAYSQRRSAMAKERGLGRKPSSPSAPEEISSAPVPKKAVRKRGRPTKER